MLLNEYQWSRNPRGMHNQGGMDMGILLGQKMGWAKIVGLGTDHVQLTAQCLANNITPIVRIYRPVHSGVPIDANMLREFSEYLAVGVKWFEIYNEPNLAIEWPSGANFDPMNIPGVIAPICENWLNWAEFIINGGGYPGFIPLSESGGGWENTTTWINQLLLYMFDHHFNRFLQIIDNGFWLPTHPYILNHFYQQMPGGGPLSARPPEMQNYAEGGWHFEYPYDPISQASDPGRTVWGGTPLSPLGDVHGLVACGEAWLERMQDMFGVGAVPVMGVEGGLWPMPQRGVLIQPDIRYPGFTWDSHAHATAALFDWSATQAPPWFFGVALWKWDYYYDAAKGGPLPAVEIFSATNPLLRDVPPIPALGSYRWRQENEAPPEIPTITIDPPGPGPVHGQPTFHFMILAPGIEETWFFEVTRVYWERFKPTLMTIQEFINFLPNEVSLAVSILTTPDLVNYMNLQIARRWPNIYMDMIVADDQRQVEELLNSRVAVGRRFG